MSRASEASGVGGSADEDWLGLRRGSGADWATAIGVALLLAAGVRFFWTRFPHPQEMGNLLLGLGTMLATGVAFGKGRKGQPFGQQAVTFAVVMAAAQAVIQLAGTIASF